MQLNDNIKLIRELSGIKQKDFAKLIKTNVSNLKTYENTDIRAKAPVLAAIADIAGITVEELEKKKLTHKDVTITLPEKDEKDGKDENATEKPQEAQDLTIGGSGVKLYLDRLKAQITTLESNLASTLKLQQAIHDHLLALSWYHAHRTAGGNEKKALIELSKINSKADEYRLVNEKTDKAPDKRRSKVIKVVPLGKV